MANRVLSSTESIEVAGAGPVAELGSFLLSSETVEDIVEGVLADFARRAAAAGHASLEISAEGRLIEDVCTELIWGLKLDSYDPRAVLDSVYQELKTFTQTPRNRSWGTVTYEYGRGIMLNVDRAAALSVPNLRDIDADKWIASS
jgi:hypothetical protein